MDSVLNAIDSKPTKGPETEAELDARELKKPGWSRHECRECGWSCYVEGAACEACQQRPGRDRGTALKDHHCRCDECRTWREKKGERMAKAKDLASHRTVKCTKCGELTYPGCDLCKACSKTKEGKEEITAKPEKSTPIIDRYSFPHQQPCGCVKCKRVVILAAAAGVAVEPPKQPYGPPRTKDGECDCQGCQAYREKVKAEGRKAAAQDDIRSVKKVAENPIIGPDPFVIGQLEPRLAADPQPDTKVTDPPLFPEAYYKKESIKPDKKELYDAKYLSYDYVEDKVV